MSNNSDSIYAGKCQLYINGFHIDTKTNYSDNELAGPNASGTGNFYDVCPKIRDPAKRSFNEPWNLTECYLYKDIILPIHTGASPDKTLTGISEDVDNTLENANACVIKIISNFDSSQHGILYEAGGSGLGIAVYIFDKNLYVQAGRGDNFGGDIEFVLPLS